MGFFIIIIFLVVGIGFIVFFIAKSISVPKKSGQILELLQKGKTQIVIKAAKAMLAKEPQSADAHYFLGKAYLLDKREELAYGEYKLLSQSGKTGEYIPEEDFRKEAAQLYVKNRQIEEALKEYILLIKKAPDKAEYYYCAGKLFNDRNRSDKAQNYLRKAAELAPRDAKIQFELGVMLYKSKNSVDAKAALERSLKYQADNSQAYFYLGRIQKDGKDFAGATATLEKAARDPAYRLRALFERGSCYIALNAIDKAILDLERATKSITEEAAQESIYTRYYLAMCYEKSRNIVKAVEQWDKIQTHKKGFKDVEAKLQQYNELQNDDTMKDFLSAANAGFMEICKKMTLAMFSMPIKSSKDIPDGAELIAADTNDGSKVPRLIRVYRSPNPVEDTKVRSILDAMKQFNVGRTVIISSSGFTRQATEYAESRPVELFGKDKLLSLLKKSLS
jgi:tetratricopeptide (TPR) repeat protein